ncbi:MAG: hypothetical protein J2P31_20575 [Blastocatellia bacterium]|nr:hypothetical protein [Blastocatellia bacterium]
MTPEYEQVLSLAQALPATERLRLISELAKLLAQSELRGQENGTERTLPVRQDDEAWWAEFFAKIDATPEDESLPADLSTNPKYMEGYGEDGPTLRKRNR